MDNISQIAMTKASYDHIDAALKQVGIRRTTVWSDGEALATWAGTDLKLRASSWGRQQYPFCTVRMPLLGEPVIASWDAEGEVGWRIHFHLIW